MKQLLIMVMACYALTSSAQMRQNDDFLYLFNDSVVYADRVTLRPSIYGSLQIRADSRQVPINQVKFINNRDGFFANTAKMSLIQTTSFSERVIEGKVNLFQAIPDEVFIRDRWNRHEYVRGTTPTLRMYYNKGNGDLKKVRYHTLMEDLSDNKESIDLLNGYRKNINTSKILYVSAGVSIVAGMVAFLTAGSNQKPAFGGDFGKSPNFTSSYILIGLSPGLALGGYLNQLSGQRKLERAIDSYNR